VHVNENPSTQPATNSGSQPEPHGDSRPQFHWELEGEARALADTEYSPEEWQYAANINHGRQLAGLAHVAGEVHELLAPPAGSSDVFTFADPVACLFAASRQAGHDPQDVLAEAMSIDQGTHDLAGDLAYHREIATGVRQPTLDPRPIHHRDAATPRDASPSGLARAESD
jgi:hypothetical protein